MTDNEIMKALECCETGDCIHCPRWKNGWISGDCSDLTTLALDLINRQKAEIERLHNEVKEKTESLDEEERNRYKAAFRGLLSAMGEVVGEEEPCEERGEDDDGC